MPCPTCRAAKSPTCSSPSHRGCWSRPRCCVRAARSRTSASPERSSVASPTACGAARSWSPARSSRTSAVEDVRARPTWPEPSAFPRLPVMGTGRLEAFSDGVLAIIITIMVLELHVPEGEGWDALGDSTTSLVTYLLSFVYIGIYWSNHHHMIQLTERVSGTVLWANLHLLFW